MSAASRVVSLLPSATEIVCALGAGERLVGRSHECDYPPGVERAPVLSRPRLDVEAPSARIDLSVKALVEKGLSVFEVDAQRLRGLSPDVVLTQTQCEVCAVTPADLQAALNEWTGASPQIVSLAPATLDEVWRSVERIAEALGAARRGREIARSLRRRCDALSRPAPADPPRVAAIEWIDPLMAAGNWVPELIARAGAQGVFGEAGAPSRWLEAGQLRAADPDWVVVMPCGFALERTVAEMAADPLDGKWLPSRARRADRVALADGHNLFNRPGPRLVESLEVLLEILHPGTDHGHRGRHWRSLAAEARAG